MGSIQSCARLVSRNCRSSLLHRSNNQKTLRGRHRLGVVLCPLASFLIQVPHLFAEQQQGSAPTHSRMILLLKRSPAQRAAMEKLLTDLQDPRSPQYHKWLKPAEVARRFGASDAQIERLRRSVEAHGLQLKVHANRLSFEVSGDPDTSKLRRLACTFS